MIKVCVFAFVAFHPGYGFQNTFNAISKHHIGSKDAVSMTPLQQDPTNEHQTTEYHSGMA
jgi:hypothetical protein